MDSIVNSMKMDGKATLNPDPIKNDELKDNELGTEFMRPFGMQDTTLLFRRQRLRRGRQIAAAAVSCAAARSQIVRAHT